MEKQPQKQSDPAGISRDELVAVFNGTLLDSESHSSLIRQYEVCVKECTPQALSVISALSAEALYAQLGLRLLSRYISNRHHGSWLLASLPAVAAGVPCMNLAAFISMSSCLGLPKEDCRVMESLPQETRLQLLNIHFLAIKYMELVSKELERNTKRLRKLAA